MSAHLSKVINEMNWEANYNPGYRVIDRANLTVSDAIRIYRYIDCELSPEHLHQDGERSSAEVDRFVRMYDGAVTALQRMGFRMPADTFNM